MELKSKALQSPCLLQSLTQSDFALTFIRTAISLLMTTGVHGVDLGYLTGAAGLVVANRRQHREVALASSLVSKAADCAIRRRSSAFFALILHLTETELQKLGLENSKCCSGDPCAPICGRWLLDTT